MIKFLTSVFLIIAVIGCSNNIVINNGCYGDINATINELPHSGNYLLFFTGYSAYSDNKAKEIAHSILQSKTLKKSLSKKKIKTYILFIDSREPWGDKTKGEVNKLAMLNLTKSYSVPSYIIISNQKIISLQKGSFKSNEFEKNWKEKVIGK